MYQVIKRDGHVAEFSLNRISSAIMKAFDATHIPYAPDVIDLLSLQVTADYADKIRDGRIDVETIQDSVEAVLQRAGYAEVAKAYILYRKNREKLRNMSSTILDYKKLVDDYLRVSDWRVKENSTVTYSVGGLILSNSGAITANYWLSEIYDEEIGSAHRNADLHIHDLSMLTGYCAGWSLKQLIQEVRVNKPEINEGKIKVKRLINEKYYHIFGGEMNSSELWRYNFYLYQLENMRKADLRRMDNRNKRVDISSLVDFHPVAPDHEFSPLLVNPNLNIELSSFSETFEELMSFPNYPEFAEEFAAKLDRLYIADGYSEETNINNMIVQLLILEGYISSDDLAQGSVIEKVNRETIAAAKHAVVQYLNRQRSERAAEQPRTAAKKTPEKSKQERNK